MRIFPECIPCIINMTIDSCRKIIKDENIMRQLFEEVMGLDLIKRPNWRVTPPEIIKDVWVTIESITNNSDPLHDIKKRQNDVSMEVYPLAERTIMETKDPFVMALKWTVLGNFIDIMAGVKEVDTEDILHRIKKINFDKNSVENFKERMKKSRKIVYLCDNCGEIVFDKLFGDTIKKFFGCEITFVVRSKSVLNDATIRDAQYVKLSDVGRVIENGINEPFPGTSIEKISEELREILKECDLVISKGGGNFDTLSDEILLKGKITFLLQAKCTPYVMIHGVKKHDFIVSNA